MQELFTKEELQLLGNEYYITELDATALDTRELSSLVSTSSRARNGQVQEYFQYF